MSLARDAHRRFPWVAGLLVAQHPLTARAFLALGIGGLAHMEEIDAVARNLSAEDVEIASVK